LSYRPSSAFIGGQDRGTWLALLFVVVGVLAPTACVIWFMNAAAQGQAEAAKQTIARAYHGQLVFVRDSIEQSWQRRAAALEQSAGLGRPADFARNIQAGVADSLIYRNPDGSVSYPTLTTNALSEPPGTQADSTAARAAQAKIRTLIPDKEAALRAIEENFNTGRTARGLDPQGRLIAADEQLLVLHLLQPRDTRRAAVTRRLTDLLNDYQNTLIPAPQRLFLMDEVRALTPNARFPTYTAEHLAAQFLEADDPRPTGSGLESTHVPGLWKLPTKSGRVIALYRTDTALAALRAVLNNTRLASGARIDIVPPGESPQGDNVNVGAMLPNWQLALTVVDTKWMDESARSRMASYLWAGYLLVGAMAITGLLAGQFFRKQVRLARLKTDLVSAVSHELKTPLASMRLLVDSLLEDPAFDPVKTREYLQLISGENLRLNRLVENFLTFSRLERNRHNLELKEIAPADVVGSVAAIVRERFQGMPCDFTSSVESGLPAIHADPDALLSALLNLLDNAYKYTSSNKRIRLEAYSEPGLVVFAVEDNGMGIAAREQERIFRRFYQIDRRLARETGGCGLGLSIVDSIVRAHGGSVRITSRPGSGSTFRLCLPF
jgi:signal transduction histidine kinase